MPLKQRVALMLLLFCMMPLSSYALPLPEVKELKLSNGMKFLLVKKGESPIFSAIIRFRVGGADEEPGKTGLAHFAEHMAFKGTKKLSEVELARRIEEEGGKGLNAMTSKDMTSYVVSLPSDKLSFWAELESERIFDPVFRDFEQERSVIMEERRQRIEDDPDGRLTENILAEAFKGTPYGWPTIGTMEDLKTLTLQDLQAFWQRHYRPQNAVGVIVGNFDILEAEKLLKRTFGRRSGGKTGAAARVETAPFREEKRVNVKREAQPRIVLGYLKPNIPSLDDYVFDLISEILAAGRSSRLYKKLVLERRIVNRVEVYTGFPGDRGSNLFWIQLEPLEGHSPEEVIAAADEEIARFRMEGPTEKEMLKASNQILSQLIWGLRKNSGLAYQLSHFEIAAGTWRYLETYLDRISEIGPDQVKKTAESYLKRDNRVVGVLGP